LRDISRLADYRWLAPLIPQLENPRTANAAANHIRSRDPEVDAILRTTLSPTMLSAGSKINVIPNTAEAQIDVRRLPDETHAEILARLRQIVHDPAIEVKRSEEHTSELQSRFDLVCRLLLEKKKK